MSGLGALKRLGEFLMRQSEKDERLARAVEQGYDLLNPMVHGTNKPLPIDESLRPLFLTREPDMALNYTGGGRRAGPGSPARGGLSQVMVMKGEPLKTDAHVFDLMPGDDPSWVTKYLGIDPPDEFQRMAREVNAEKLVRWAKEREAKGLVPFGTEPDPYWGMYVNDTYRRVYPEKFYGFLDDEGFTAALNKVGVNALEFNHPYTANRVSPRGRVLRSPDSKEATAIFIADPSIVRSPWAEFKEQGVGLMKKTGGLVQACGCK